ncbi:MAG: aminotransferase class I/II-fold pyridoxal phosphate-dependent enzyme [bacterium]|nr:aminotransferase class I/II-fold pyridoxal phosphate-dependent enzyme [bacterium]
MALDQLSQPQLRERERELSKRHDALRKKGLALDLTRGKPSSEQLDLSAELDRAWGGSYLTADGTDARNYGGMLGIPEARAFGAELLGLRTEEILVGDNSSLSLMYRYIAFAHQHGLAGSGTGWRDEAAEQGRPAQFLCPVPGYDRHFGICEHFGIEMVNVALEPEGPDMDAIEERIAGNPLIKGIWCVPRHSNPTGQTYADSVVERLAALPLLAGPNFRIFWDNAYAVHHLQDDPPELRNIMEACRERGTEEGLPVFGSTSKITYAGSGISFLGANPSNLASFQRHLAASTIGPDKINQLRHVRFLRDMSQLKKHMARHRAIIAPKFRRVLEMLEEALRDELIATWTDPPGGYFISVDTLPGLASEVVRLAGEAGVKLTPAGATFPYGRDPQDRNIRLAPTFPPMSELEQAMQVFVVCLELASVRQRLGTMERRDAKPSGEQA